MHNAKKVAIIQTSFVSTDHLNQLFEELLPEVQVMNLVDDSLLREVMANDGITPAVIRRVCAYAEMAVLAGAEILFNQCSSVGEAVNVARTMVSVPFLKVDEPMARSAVAQGAEIVVVATVKSTLKPSVGLVEEAARAAGKSVRVRPELVDGALDILMKEQDREKHNALVLERIDQVARTADVVVLAQGSMAVLEPELKGMRVPVLTSPRSGVESVRDLILAGTLR